MARVIDVEVEQERIKINFPYHRELVEVVRTLPDRWYDNRTKTWFVPLEHLSYVIRRLDGYRFKFSPRLRQYRSDQGDTEVEPEPAMPEVPSGTWTISRLNQEARAILRNRFDEPIWVVGELQDFEKNKASNYRTYFFDLVERPFAGANEVARLKAVLFERHRKTVRQRLRDSDLELSDGTAVRMRGRVDLYPRNGRYQILVEDIDPAYTAGDIELNRERVYRVLRKKGIEEKNRALSWPVCPLKVGLITSYESDAYNDFVHQLETSGRGFSLVVHDANVQGVYTERSVLRALSYFRERADEFDVVAIIRGGGSRSELAYFDTEAIGEAVCRHPVKIVCGVGHQRDTSLLDLIAESTKTPTAAANSIVDRVDRFRRAVDEVYAAIAHKAGRRVEFRRQQLVRGANRLERQVIRRLGTERRRQDRLSAQIAERSRRALVGRRRSVDRLRGRLQMSARRQTERRRHQIDGARQRLSKRRLVQGLQRRRDRLQRLIDELRKSTLRDTRSARRRLAHLQEQLALIDPRRVLDRGFALVRTDEGVARGADEIPLGSEFDVILGKGVLRARRIEDERRRDDEAAAETGSPQPAE